MRDAQLPVQPPMTADLRMQEGRATLVSGRYTPWYRVDRGPVQDLCTLETTLNC